VKRVLFFPLFVLLSCVRVNVGSDSPATVIHKLDYGLPLAQERARETTIRIFDFAVIDEYDRKALVLVLANGTVKRTGFHQWASAPGLALPDLLHRDLLAETSFSAVYRRGAVEGRELIIEGFVREFGARESNAEWVAVLDVDLLMRYPGETQGKEQRTYRLSRTLPQEGYHALVQTLSSLVEEWSKEVRSDIRTFLDARGDR
jgi:uncharacterized lipoprotein YmbA